MVIFHWQKVYTPKKEGVISKGKAVLGTSSRSWGLVRNSRVGTSPCSQLCEVDRRSHGETAMVMVEMSKTQGGGGFTPPEGTNISRISTQKVGQFWRWWFSNFPFGGICWIPRGYKVRNCCDKIGITIWKIDRDFVFLFVTLCKLIHFQMPSPKEQLSLRIFISDCFPQTPYQTLEAFRI